jgi:PEP-CTERM motif-containing protein
MRTNLLAAFAVVMLVGSQATAQNLVDNPSFEDPTVTTGSANDVWFRFGSGAGGTSSESTVMPRTGSRHIALELIGPNQFAGLFQNLNMTINPGQILNFSGFARNASGGPFAATQEIKLEWQGTPNPPQSRLDDLTLGSAYEMFSHTATAPAGTTGLVVTYAISSFGAGQGGDSIVHIDDFSVTIVPEPATIGLLGLGSLGLVAFARRRRK